MTIKSDNELSFETEVEKLTKQDQKNRKSSLTRDINWYLKEIEWITRDDNSGRPISKYYLGKLREPQLRILRRELKELQNNREKLEFFGYVNKLQHLILEEWSVNTHYCEFIIAEYEDFLFACFRFNIKIKDLPAALKNIISY